jgi:hypothetical protein
MLQVIICQDWPCTLRIEVSWVFSFTDRWKATQEFSHDLKVQPLGTVGQVSALTIPFSMVHIRMEKKKTCQERMELLQRVLFAMEWRVDPPAIKSPTWCTEHLVTGSILGDSLLLLLRVSQGPLEKEQLQCYDDLVPFPSILPSTTGYGKVEGRTVKRFLRGESSLYVCLFCAYLHQGERRNFAWALFCQACS